jgi:hypothetical protein
MSLSQIDRWRSFSILPVVVASRIYRVAVLSLILNCPHTNEAVERDCRHSASRKSARDCRLRT